MIAELKTKKFHYLQVMDLGMGHVVEFYNTTPKKAVLEAYAQSVGDRYHPERYEHLIIERAYTVQCGVYKCYKDGQLIDPLL